ncbi:ACT domain-containing protein [Ruminococcus sp. Marseille-P6503]|uniref:ACT domain-containing protein n=1 Tax=Ruminococcus sp. Marseille-P6503 TaxID=2364796 RepID=UPI000F54AD45|nr:ACT domain-containing protein [Ruminococcus sp. Marseille-P6503]
MTVKQLSVFVENRPGRLSAITRLLGDNGINIRAMSIADTKDFGILRLIVNDADKALEILKNAGCSVTITNVLAIRISDRPGGLADAMDILYKDNISVEYMYAAFINEQDETAYLVLRVDSNDNAVTALNESGFHLLSQEELSRI